MGAVTILHVGSSHDVAQATERIDKDMVARGIGGSDLNLGKFMRSRIWLGIFVGSTIGGFIPELWDAGLMSYSSVLLSGIGAFVGLWIGYKMD